MCFITLTTIITSITITTSYYLLWFVCYCLLYVLAVGLCICPVLLVSSSTTTIYQYTLVVELICNMYYYCHTCHSLPLSEID